MSAGFDRRDVIDALEDAGLEPQSYSGRGMFGRHCLAVVTDDSVWELAVALFEELSDAGYDGARIVATLEAMGSPSTDQMGRSGIVVYWPSIAWDDGDDEVTES